MQKIRENHWRGTFRDQSVVTVDQYNDRGLSPNYFWETFLKRPTPTNEDMEIARQEACRAFLERGGHFIITILDSMQIPENDRNSPTDCREGHREVIGKDQYGFDVVAKKKTGDPGDQYYGWSPLTESDLEKRLARVREELAKERRKR